MAERIDATDALVETFRTNYPNKGFSISDKIKFIHSKGKGLCILAKRDIPKDENIMVIPTTESFGITKFLKNGPGGPGTMRNELVELGKEKQQIQEYLSTEDFLLAVSIMEGLSKKCRGIAPRSISMAQAATWPSEDEMKNSSWYYWDVIEVQKIWNQSSIYFGFEEMRKHVRVIFDDVLWSYFNSASGALNVDAYIDTSLPSNASNNNKREQAWNTFIYALSLAWSRAHQYKDTDPVLIPLVELFNGHSERINESAKKGKLVAKTVINVNIARGAWPFMGGGRFINECNLPCSCIYANRAISEGEELILSYGVNLTPTGFIAKYGALPEDFLYHHNIISDFSLWTPPQYIPTESMRVKCLEQNDFPLDFLKQSRGDTALLHVSHEIEDLDMYRRGNETDRMKSARQYLILAVLADEFELNRNYTSGRLRGPLYESRVMRVMCQVIDYNLNMLSGDSTTTSAQDIEIAAAPNTFAWKRSCLLARVCYRESLIMWRHAFVERGQNAKKFEEYSEIDVGPLPSFQQPHEQAEYLDKGCIVCGRSYPSKKCGKCKQVQFCTRAHQMINWKEHKHVCGK